MPLVELYKTRSLQADAVGNRGAARTWRVPGASDIATARALFAAEPELAIFPDDPTLVLDRIDVMPSPTGAEWRVTAVYSNFRGGQLDSGPQIDRPGWYHFDWGKRRAEVDVVWNVKEWRVPDRDTTQKYQVWVPKTTKAIEWRVQYTLRVLIVTENINIFDPIAEELGNLHNIHGQVYQFVDADVRNSGGLNYHASYTWERDNGTFMPTPIGNDAEGFWLALPVPQPNQSIYRPPYQQVVAVIPAENPRTTRATVRMSRAPRLVETGWQYLPGTGVL